MKTKTALELYTSSSDPTVPTVTAGMLYYKTSTGLRVYDGSAWSTVGAGSAITAKDEGTNLTTSMTSIDFVGSGVTATNSGGAVTVTIPGGGGGGTLDGLSDVDTTGAANDYTISLSVGAATWVGNPTTVTSSGYNGTNYDTNAWDNNDATYWNTNGVSNPWTIADFGTAISADTIYARSNSVSDTFTLYGSSNGTSWTTVKTGIVTNGSTYTWSPVSYRYWKLQATTAWQDPSFILKSTANTWVAVPRFKSTNVVAGTNVTVDTTTTPGSAIISASGGGGGGWDQLVNDDMSSLSAFTGVTGSWSISGGVTQQTSTSASPMRLRTNAKVTRAVMIAEVECRYDSGAGSIRRMGIGLGWDASSGGASVGFLQSANGTTWGAHQEADSALANTDISVSYAGSGYVKVRIVSSGGLTHMYVDGTYVTTFGSDPVRIADSYYVYLYTYGAAASFKNLKVWALTEPA